jgi:hypothetical protein
MTGPRPARGCKPRLDGSPVTPEAVPTHTYPLSPRGKGCMRNPCFYWKKGISQ